MMRATNLAAIHAAELRVAQSRQSTRDGLRRARAAFRATLTHPSTLVLVAGAAGLFSFWVARRSQTKSARDDVGIATATSVLGFVLALIVRYGMQGFPFVLRQIQAARQQRATQADRDVSISPDSIHSSTGVLH